jgi:hypothetical protein
VEVYTEGGGLHGGWRSTRRVEVSALISRNKCVRPVQRPTSEPARTAASVHGRQAQRSHDQDGAAISRDVQTHCIPAQCGRRPSVIQRCHHRMAWTCVSLHRRKVHDAPHGHMQPRFVSRSVNKTRDRDVSLGRPSSRCGFIVAMPQRITDGPRGCRVAPKA